MSGKIAVTVIVTTLNEERNLARCLAALDPFDEVVVVDSNSRDGTSAIARSFGARVVDFAWDGHYPKKRQWTLDNVDLKHAFVFFVDADEEVTPALCREIGGMDSTYAGYFVRGDYVANGKRLRFGFTNKKLCLFDRTKMAFPVVDDLDLSGMWEIEGHYQPCLKPGFEAEKIGRLKNGLLHHALDDVERYRERHEGYARWKAGMAAKGKAPRDATLSRRAAKAVFEAFPAKAAMLYVFHYIVRLGFLERRRNGEILRQKSLYHTASARRKKRSAQ